MLGFIALLVVEFKLGHGLLNLVINALARS